MGTPQVLPLSDHGGVVLASACPKKYGVGLCEVRRTALVEGRLSTKRSCWGVIWGRKIPKVGHGIFMNWQGTDLSALSLDVANDDLLGNSFLGPSD